MSKNIFNSVQFPKVDTNRFDLSHDVKLSFRMGELVPTCVMDTLPGDIVSISTQNMLRFAPLISPVMHHIKVNTHFFFVPNRIIWPEWEDFITGTDDVIPPYVEFGDLRPVVGSLADYIGMPTVVNLGYQASALPFGAYAKIYWEYYRDQNLIDELTNADFANVFDFTELREGVYDATIGWLQDDRPLKRAWNHDYFTGALPFAQKGDAVTIPLGDFTDVDIISNAAGFPYPSGSGAWLDRVTGNNVVSGGQLINNAVGGTTTNTTAQNVVYDPTGTLLAQTSQLSLEAATIDNLRRAFRLQEWLEKNARGGTRYKENIMAHFGVNSSDARLQRPEYLGGSSQNMVISEVLATAQNDTVGQEVPVGDMAGHGISVGGGKQFKYRCEEHGWIIGIINVQPVTAYQQGLHRMFSRTDKLDYYWPTFQHIGEQEVLNKEIYVDNLAGREETFGYVPRYSEYKYVNSRVAGEFRTTLAHWHLGRIFENLPALNADFIQADYEDMTRIFAVEENADHIYAHVFNRVSAVRKMARYGNPHL